MIIVSIVVCCLALFVILCKQLEDHFNEASARVLKNQKKAREVLAEQVERISTLEIKDYAQDARLDNHAKNIKGLREDVNEIGKDIGWKEDNRRTQVMKTKDPHDVE